MNPRNERLISSPMESPAMAIPIGRPSLRPFIVPTTPKTSARIAKTRTNNPPLPRTPSAGNSQPTAAAIPRTPAAVPVRLVRCPLITGRPVSPSTDTNLTSDQNFGGAHDGDAAIHDVHARRRCRQSATMQDDGHFWFTLFRRAKLGWRARQSSRVSSSVRGSTSALPE